MVISSTDPNRISYSKMTKKLKSSIDLDALGVMVNEMKKTSSGAVALAVGIRDRGAEAAEKLRVAIEAVLGANTGVRISSNTLRLHVMGVSGDDDSAEIRDGVIREGVPPIKSRSSGRSPSAGATKWRQSMCRSMLPSDC